MNVLYKLQKKVVGIEDNKIVLVHTDGTKEYPKLHPCSSQISYTYPEKVCPRTDKLVRNAFTKTGLYTEEQYRTEPIKKYKSYYLSGTSAGNKAHNKEQAVCRILSTKLL